MTEIFQSPKGDFYEGNAKGVTAKIVYPDLDLYEEVYNWGLYRKFVLKEQYRTSIITNRKRETVLHR